MAKQTRREYTESHFAKLTRGLESDKPVVRIPTLSPEGLELLAFDLESRHSLAEFRAWLHTPEGRRALQECREEVDTEEVANSSDGEFTDKQRELALRIEKVRRSSSR